MDVTIPVRPGRLSACIALFRALLWLACGYTTAQEHMAGADRANPGQIVYLVKPSHTDPSIRHFDENHYVVFDPASSEHGELVVFMPGTHGKPADAARLLHVIAGQGYRVLGLEYNDDPAVVQICPLNPSPLCSGEFRRERIFGNAATSFVDNSTAESIVNRLTKLLEYLDQRDPGSHWSSYLRGGTPDWTRIVVSGLSQGAGMAAYIAKRERVARVVLFSSPWDYYYAPLQTPAPWLAETSATPPERWFAEYHKRENTAELIARSYRVLRIPSENTLIFDLSIVPALRRGHSGNPFHGSTIRVPDYEPQWKFLFGHSP